MVTPENNNTIPSSKRIALDSLRRLTHKNLEKVATPGLLEKYKEQQALTIKIEYMEGVIGSMENYVNNEFKAFQDDPRYANTLKNEGITTARQLMSSGPGLSVVRDEFMKKFNDINLSKEVKDLSSKILNWGDEFVQNRKKNAVEFGAKMGRQFDRVKEADHSQFLDEGLGVGVPTALIAWVAGLGIKKSLATGTIVGVAAATPSITNPVLDGIGDGMAYVGGGLETTRKHVFDAAHFIATGRAKDALTGQKHPTTDSLMKETLGSQSEQLQYYPVAIQNLYQKLDRKENLSDIELGIAADFIVKNTGDAVIKPGEINVLKSKFDNDLLFKKPEEKIYDQTLILKYISNKAAAGLLLQLGGDPKFKVKFSEKISESQEKQKNGDPKLAEYNFATLRQDFGGKINFKDIEVNDVRSRLESVMPDMALNGVQFAGKYFLILWALIQGGLTVWGGLKKLGSGAGKMTDWAKKSWLSKRIAAKEELKNKGSAKKMFKYLNESGVITDKEFKALKTNSVQNKIGYKRTKKTLLLLKNDEYFKSKLLAANFTGDRARDRSTFLEIEVTDVSKTDGSKIKMSELLSSVGKLDESGFKKSQVEKYKEGSKSIKSIVKKGLKISDERLRFTVLKSWGVTQFIGGFGKVLTAGKYQNEDKDLKKAWVSLDLVGVAQSEIDAIRIREPKDGGSRNSADFRDQQLKDTWELLVKTNNKINSYDPMANSS